jgi:hypothetical protein
MIFDYLQKFFQNTRNEFSIIIENSKITIFLCYEIERS